MHAIHFAFEDGMMLRKIELGVSLQVTREAGGRIPAGIDDKFAVPPASGHMLAARPMAGFATGGALQAHAFKMQTRVRTAGKDAGIFLMAIRADLVPDVVGPFDLRRLDNGALQAGAREETHSAQDHSGTA